MVLRRNRGRDGGRRADLRWELFIRQRGPVEAEEPGPAPSGLPAINVGEITVSYRTTEAERSAAAWYLGTRPRALVPGFASLAASFVLLGGLFNLWFDNPVAVAVGGVVAYCATIFVTLRRFRRRLSVLDAGDGEHCVTTFDSSGVADGAEGSEIFLAWSDLVGVRETSGIIFLFHDHRHPGHKHRGPCVNMVPSRALGVDGPRVRTLIMSNVENAKFE